jgi:Zn-dependent protease with chaperone function
MFIVQPMMANGRRMGTSGSLWSSHPPIEERIQRLRSLGNIEG